MYNKISRIYARSQRQGGAGATATVGPWRAHWSVAKLLSLLPVVMAESVPLDSIPGRTPLTRQQIGGFWAAWAGWLLDGMDSVIYALVLAPALTELLPRSGVEPTPADVGYAGSILFALRPGGHTPQAQAP